ncbi:MAG TPA: sel1 repeat family protein, partial [Nitratifractor sp.]|nr:sel1 repeat family protein [Nitratifractor sp.]
KYRQFFKIYPPIKESDVWVEVVIKFLKNIAKSSYTQKDIESFLEEYDYFAGKNDLARAAQVILLAGASDSKLAQFRLARELFNGKVLQRNLQASFEIIKRLSTDFYPEAVCDLAQFYEYGLGVPKDKKVALKLYEKAFEVGSVRASKHINRLKESGGFLSSILKLK